MTGWDEPSNGEIADGGLARFLKAAGRAHLWGEVVVEIDDETTHLVLADGGLAVRTRGLDGEGPTELMTRVLHRLLRAERGTWQARPLVGVAGADRLLTEPIEHLVVEATLRRASKARDEIEAARVLPPYDELGPLVPRSGGLAPTPTPTFTPPPPQPAPTVAPAPPVPAPAPPPRVETTPTPERRPVNPRIEMEHKRLASLGATAPPPPQRRTEDKSAERTPEEEAERRARVEALRAQRASQVRYSLRNHGAGFPRSAPSTAAPDGVASPSESSKPPTRRRALRSLIRTLASEPRES